MTTGAGDHDSRDGGKLSLSLSTQVDLIAGGYAEKSSASARQYHD